MADTEKERRWTVSGIGRWLAVEGPRPLRAPNGLREVEVMPVSEHEADLAKARKEGREEVREPLESIKARLDGMQGRQDNGEPHSPGWLQGEAHEVAKLARNLLDSLTKEGD